MKLMNRKFLLTTSALVMGIVATSMPASAGSSNYGGDTYDRTDVRQANQARRIEQGIRSGQLTPREAAKLKDQQAHIRHLERDAERDGRISRVERSRIEAAQDAASRSIYAEKHDGDTRGHHGHRRWFERSSHDNHHHHNGHRRWYRFWF